MRKKCVYFTSIILVLLVLAGCGIFPNIHRVRITSAVTDGNLTNVKIGAVSYGTIETGGTTKYGDFKRAAPHQVTIGSGDTVINTITLTGLGPHLWTLTIGGTLANMTFTLSEDQ